MKSLFVIALLVGGSFAALAPVRHSARLEQAEGNPVQRVMIESHSLLGLHRKAWGAKLEGVTSWGSSRDGFFVSPVKSARVELKAWPRFSQSFELQPTGKTAASISLRDEGDREAFRRWFVAILEDQLERVSPAWEPAQRDCAGLMRFAFHEAWGPHDAAWKERLSFTGTFVAKVPSRDFAGPWAQAFPTPDGWQPFAKGAFLRDYACLPMSREVQEGKPGDLIFFSRGGARKTPDHVMAFARPDADGTPVLIYHTGGEGSAHSRDAGDMRRVRLSELLQHPDPAFRPQPENPAFLGVYRWKVLTEAL
jgi:uncharacterized protein